MLGDTAVAVHPSDERYQSLIGKQIRLPLTNRLIPIIADPFVDPTFGSGAVKITPAHDFNDYEVAERQCLPLLNIMTPDGRINEEGGKYAGLSMEEAREAILKDLKEQDFLEKIEPHALRVGISYRSKAVIEPYLSKQWFIRMSHFKDKLLSAVREGRIKLVPPHWQGTYEHWIENLRDWCISRQLWWGHRIPIWYNKENPERTICFDGEGVPPEVLENPDHWQQDPDVLDTWFSSALWPFSVLGWPDETADLKKFYPTATLITGHDILFFWVARMILMGEYAMDDVPFRETFLHGLIYGKSYWRNTKDGGVAYVSSEEKKRFDLGENPPKDVESKWEKMSKSKGNVIDPIELIEDYGTDAMRLALCSSVTHARQIDLDRRKFEEFKNFANKIWNGARFVFLNVEDLTAEELSAGLDLSILSLEDRWILSVFNRTIAELNESLASYTFDRLATRAYEFFWNDFCATYVELVKPTLFGKAGTPELRKNRQKLLAILLSGAIRLLHPIAPFITEEIFSLLKERFSEVKPAKDSYTQDFAAAMHSPACMKAPYPQVFDRTHISFETEEMIAELFKLVYAIRNIRAEMQIPPSEKTELFLFGDSPLAKENQGILLALTPTSALQFTSNEADLPAFGASAIVGSLKLVIPIPASLKIKEKARLEKEREKLEKQLEGTKAKLSNPDFRAKAPSELIQTFEKNLDQTSRQLEEVQEKLRQI